MHSLNKNVFGNFRIAALVIIGCFAFCPGAPADAVENPSYETNIKLAKYYYWIGMQEKGNYHAFLEGLELLDIAEKQLEDGDVESGQMKLVADKIDSLRIELDEQSEMSVDTLIGVYPLTRFLDRQAFHNPLDFGTFEVLDDTKIMAACMAAQNMANTVIEQWRSVPQLDVIFTSDPPNETLENEVLYVFNTNPKFFVHNRMELQAALNDEVFASLQDDVLDSRTLKALKKEFKSDDILLVKIIQEPAPGGDSFVTLTGKYYQAESGTLVRSISNMGFSRDRNHVFTLIKLLNLVMFLLALASFFFGSKLTRGWLVKLDYKEVLSLTAIAFLLGRFIPLALTPLLAKGIPEAELLAISTFWWPVFLFLAIYIVPLVVFRGFSGRAKFLAIIPDIAGRGGIVGIITALGTTTFVAELILVYFGSYSLIYIFPLLISSCSANWLIGKAMDDDPRPLLSGSAGLAILLMLAYAAPALSSPHLMASAILGLICVVANSRFREISSEVDPYPVISSKIPSSLRELEKAAKCPEYKRFGWFKSTFMGAHPILEGKTAWLVLSGPGGRGKTATARKIISVLEDKFSKMNEHIEVLMGTCSSDSSRSAYEPFQQAFAGLFNINLFAPQSRQRQVLETAMEGLVSYALPFSSLFFPPTSEFADEEITREQVFNSLIPMIEALAKTKPLVLMIDDAQWIDECSRDLLHFLLQKFEPGGDLPLLVLITTRDELKLGEQYEEFNKPVNKLNDTERILLLTKSLGLSDPVASKIVDQVGLGESGGGELYWLLHTIEDLAKNNAFVKTRIGFEWSEEYKSLKRLPIPTEMRNAVYKQIMEVDEHRVILVCAACIGLEFNVSLLEDALGLTRLQVLESLSYLEEKVGLISDVGEKDDVFAFRSAFVLEIVRDELGISGNGPSDSKVPQFIRECHSRIALAYENRSDILWTANSDAAKHYFAAGASKAEKSIEFCLSAAMSASSKFDFTAARKFCQMADECSYAIGKEPVTAEALMIVDCQQAHAGNLDDAAVAERGIAFLSEKKSVSPSVMIAIARTCYDAGENEKYRKKCMEIGKLIMESAKQVFYQAEGMQFYALGHEFGKRDKRIDLLSQALDLLNSCEKKGFEYESLRGRLLNALGEEGWRRNEPGDIEASREFFFRSIQVNEAINNLAGLARSYGGLSRTEMCANPLTHDSIRVAIEYAKLDLGIARECGDNKGQRVMLGQLVECKVEDARIFLSEGEEDQAAGLLEEAFKYTEDQLDCAGDDSDRAYAYFWKLSIYLELGNKAGCAEMVGKLVEAAHKLKTGLPDDVLRELKNLNTKAGDQEQELFNPIMKLMS